MLVAAVAMRSREINQGTLIAIRNWSFCVISRKSSSYVLLSKFLGLFHAIGMATAATSIIATSAPCIKPALFYTREQALQLSVTQDENFDESPCAVALLHLVAAVRSALAESEGGVGGLARNPQWQL